MAEGDLIQYSGNTNPLSISGNEVARGPKASSSQVSIARQDSRIDDSASRLIANSIQLATTAFNSIASTSDEKVAERGKESANRYAKFLNGRAADSRTGVTDGNGVTKYTVGSLEGVGQEPTIEDYSNQGNLIATGEFLSAEIQAVTDDDSLSKKEKDRIIKNLDKLTGSDLYKLQLGTRDDLFKKNNSETRSGLYQQLQESFRSPEINLNDLETMVNHDLKSLQANGEPDASIYDEVLKATSVYLTDSNIVTARFNEARIHLNELHDKGKEVTEDFAEYYQTLQKANLANTKRDADANKALRVKADKETKVALADMNRDLSVVPRAVVMPIDITNNGLDNLVENLLEENIEATINAVATSLDNTELDKVMLSLGYSDSKIADEKAKYAKRYLAKTVANDLSAITANGIPLDNLPSDIKEILKPDFISEVNTLVSTGNYDVVNEYMEGNDKIVTPIVKGRMESLLRSLNTVGTQEEFEQAKSELFSINANIEAHYIDVSEEQRVKLQALTKMPMAEYLIFTKTVQEGLLKTGLTKESLKQTDDSEWFGDSVSEILESVPYHDRARVRDIALNEQSLTGTVNATELAKIARKGKLGNDAYVADSVLKDMKSKRALEYVTDTIATKNGKEAKNLVIYKSNGMVTVTEGNALLHRFSEETFKEMYIAGEIQLNADDAESKNNANEGVFDKAIQSLRNLF